MGKKYSQEIDDFIHDNVTIYTEREFAAATNEKFGTSFTPIAINSYKKNRGWKGGRKNRERYSDKFPKEVAAFIQKNYKQTGYQAMADMLNEKFSGSYTAQNIKSYYRNHNLNSGLTGYFVKGIPLHNKGMKGLRIPGSEKGWFRSGNRPHNTVPVGIEIITDDGYHKIKVAEPNVWEFVHKKVWKENFGEIPDGMMVSFKDRNKDNNSPENLMLLTNAEHLELVRRRLRFSDPEYTDVGLTIAKINIATRKMKKKRSNT